MSSEGDLCAFFYAQERIGKFAARAACAPRGGQEKSILPGDIKGIQEIYVSKADGRPARQAGEKHPAR